MSKIIEDKIIEFLKKRKIVKTQDIEREFQLSQSTARRYLVSLEKRNLIKRNYGEVIFNNFRSVSDPNVVDNINSNTKEKKHIAKQAAKLIGDVSTIYIDSGSLCYYLLEEIEDKNIEIFTNSILNAYKAIGLGFTRVNIIGGLIKSKTLSIVDVDYELIEKINFPIAFIGVNAIHKNGDLTTPEKKEANIKKQIMLRTKNNIILAEQKKFNIESIYNFRPKDRQIIIVTDMKDISNIQMKKTKIIN